MPITKSAERALRKSTRRRAVNSERKINLKDTVKKFKKLATTNPAEAKQFLSQVYKRLDKSAKVNIIRKNTASRLKSKMTKLLK